MVFQLLTVKLHRDVLRRCFWGWGYVATLHRYIMWSVAESPSNNGYNGDYDGWDCMMGHPWISDMNKASLGHAQFRQTGDVALWIVHTLDLLRSAMSGGCPADVRRMKRLRRRQEVGRALTILKIWGETMARSLRFTETSSFSRRSSPRTVFFLGFPWVPRLVDPEGVPGYQADLEWSMNHSLCILNTNILWSQVWFILC